jgi:hypothetical protein
MTYQDVVPTPKRPVGAGRRNAGALSIHGAAAPTMTDSRLTVILSAAKDLLFEADSKADPSTPAERAAVSG